MTKKIWVYPIVGQIVISLLFGCAAPSVKVDRLSSHSFSPTPYVQVLTSAPDKPYETIARLYLAGQAGQPAAQLIAEIEKQASALGANAIILTDESTSEQPKVEMDSSGGTYRIEPAKLIPAYSALAIRFSEQK